MYNIHKFLISMVSSNQMIESLLATSYIPIYSSVKENSIINVRINHRPVQDK